MTVRDLIKELEELPMDLPVVNDLKEIDEVELCDGLYFLEDSISQYDYGSAVILR